MAIKLQSLIKVAPFSDKVRKKILSQLDELSDDQKFRLQEICWTALANQYQNRLAFEMNRMILNMAQRKGLYGQKDLAEIQTKLYLDFAKKLESASTKEEIEEVKKKLKQHSLSHRV